MHREPTMEYGGVIKGEAPPNRGGVSQYRKTTPPQHAMCQNHAGAQKHGGPGGVHPQGGVQMYGGHMNVQGGVQTWGCPTTPPSIKTCLPLKSRKNPI